MTDWSRLVVPALPQLEPFAPGPSVAELRTRYGVDELEQLDWNENVFGPLPGVLEAVVEELPNAWMYPEQAYLDFRDDVAATLGTSPRRVVPGHGVQALLGTVANTFLRPGDSVVAPTPSFYLYAWISGSRGAQMERVPLRDYRLDLEALAAAAVRTEARLVWICDPNNPTGSAIERPEWEAFLDLLPSGCVTVADETYVDFMPEERRVGRERDIDEGRTLVVLRSFSKFYGLAGLRLGYALVAEPLAAYLDLFDEPYNVSCAALAAGRASLRAVAAAEERRGQVAEARDALVDGLRRAGAEPLHSETNFVLALVDVDDTLLADGLGRRGLLVRAGSQIGIPGSVRITVGARELMERVADELAQVRAALKETEA